MTHKRNHFFLKKEKEEDLMRAYREALGRVKYIRLKDVLEETVNSPSKRFWVSEERAVTIISRIKRGDTLSDMRKNAHDMFMQINQNVIRIGKKYPNYPLYKIVSLAIEEPAPCFYMTAKSAKIIIHKIKKKCYMEKKQKLKHLFM